MERKLGRKAIIGLWKGKAKPSSLSPSLLFAPNCPPLTFSCSVHSLFVSRTCRLFPPFFLLLFFVLLPKEQSLFSFSRPHPLIPSERACALALANSRSAGFYFLFSSSSMPSSLPWPFPLDNHPERKVVSFPGHITCYRKQQKKLQVRRNSPMKDFKYRTRNFLLIIILEKKKARNLSIRKKRRGSRGIK